MPTTAGATSMALNYAQMVLSEEIGNIFGFIVTQNWMIYNQFPHSRVAIKWTSPDYPHFETILNTSSRSSSTTLGSCMTHHWFFGLVLLLEQTYLSWTLYSTHPYSNSRSASISPFSMTRWQEEWLLRKTLGLQQTACATWLA